LILYQQTCERPYERDGRLEMAQMLADYRGKGYVIAVTEAGFVPYYSGWTAIDTWGLNDQFIAHDGGITEEYLDTYKPQCIMFHDYYSPLVPPRLTEANLRQRWFSMTIPATILPILFAAFAGYAFAWLDFKGRFLLFAILVGLQVVPLQMTLVPISRLYAQLGLNGTFLGVWLFHTGFGMPYAIYLMRNFLGSLPRDLFESAYLDGASHWTAFYKLVLPLAMPAIASLGIFQFLWVWNDLLVALVFLGGTTPVMTYQISNMVTSLGAGWQLLTASAFLSMLLPMIVFFALQRYFVRGMLAGAVKG